MRFIIKSRSSSAIVSYLHERLLYFCKISKLDYLEEREVVPEVSLGAQQKRTLFN